MKKTFKLNVEGKHRDRVLDAVKHDIRKYVKRQRRVALPEGVDYWDFDCKFGLSESSAVSAHLATLTGLIDTAAQEGADEIYVEIVAKTGHRLRRPASEADASGTATAEAERDS